MKTLGTHVDIATPRTWCGPSSPTRLALAARSFKSPRSWLSTSSGTTSIGGRCRARTDDPHVVSVVLSQLS